MPQRYEFEPENLQLYSQPTIKKPCSKEQGFFMRLVVYYFLKKSIIKEANSTPIRS